MITKEDMKVLLKSQQGEMDALLMYRELAKVVKDEKDKEGKYLRKERYSGSMSRSFYVGEQITQEDIKAKFADGILTILVPKKEKQQEVEQKKYIAIEG